MQLEAVNLTLSYGSQSTAVKDVNFSIDKGDYFSILGENGSGKSTLLKGILGLIPVKSGTIRYGEGISVKDIGYMPQQANISKNFPASVWEIVLSGTIRQKGWRPFYGKEEKETALANIERLNIGNLVKKSFRDLSGGQKQRVLLARALASARKLLLLDEPVAALDPMITAEFYQLVQDLNHHDGVTVIMVSHDMTSSLRYSNKILYLGYDQNFFGSKDDYLQSDLSDRFLRGGQSC